ncbi:endoplasmic reticulum-based factor for assembly of V-ATPase-domain-containing protein [Aspergillus multicolor]|uniref:TMEM199/VMA12 family protein n=1 Tax=Aspergillus multicolor TaxID=41759 RepID=UPI003CCDA357
MVRLTITPAILSALEAIPPSSREELDLPLPETLTPGNPISHDQIIRISRYFRERRRSKGTDNDGAVDTDNNTDRSLNTLLRGTKLYIPPPPPKPEPSPEYLALKARLLAAAEADEYTRMLSPPSTSSPNPSFNSTNSKLAALHDTHIDPSLEDPNYTDPLTPSLVLNIFLSVVITGFSVYWALTSFATPEMLTYKISSVWFSSSGRSSGGGSGASEPVRVLLSLFAALAVGIAEVLIYAIYLGKIESARGKEGRRKERKVVIGSEEVRGRKLGPSEGTEVNVKVDGEDKEVIWGRGPNGGLRRRVREKWEEGTKEKDEGQERDG